MRAITVKFWIEKKNYIRLNGKEFLKGGGTLEYSVGISLT